MRVVPAAWVSKSFLQATPVQPVQEPQKDNRMRFAFDPDQVGDLIDFLTAQRSAIALHQFHEYIEFLPDLTADDCRGMADEWISILQEGLDAPNHT
jgi:hypothetical protein